MHFFLSSFDVRFPLCALLKSSPISCTMQHTYQRENAPPCECFTISFNMNEKAKEHLRVSTMDIPDFIPCAARHQKVKAYEHLHVRYCM